jgi:hypothetical protein
MGDYGIGHYRMANNGDIIEKQNGSRAATISSLI